MRGLRCILPWVLIAAAPAGMLYPLWWDPLSAGEDDVVYYWPLRAMVGEALRQGRWPVDNPLEATGMPLLADPQSAVLFPATWLFAVLDGRRAYAVSVFLAFSLAGLGTYVYSRRLALSRPASTFAACAFMFSGFFVGHRVHLAMVQTAGLFPWGLWGFEVLRSRPVRAFCCLAGVFALAVAAGHWGIGLQMSVAWAVYVLVRCRPLARSLAVVAAAAAVGVLAAGPQVIASAQMLAGTTREGIGYGTAGENSFFPAAAVLALLPMLMGSTRPNFFGQAWWGPWHLSEMLPYVGLATIVLAGAAVWRIARKGPAGVPEDEADRLRPVVRLWTWLAAGAFVWMLGYYLPTYRLVHLLPVIGKVRCPARLVLVVDFALALLAGAALHCVSSAGATQRARLLCATVRRMVLRYLPIALVAALALLAAGAAVARATGWGRGPGFGFFAGTTADALAAVVPWNPAVWVPAALMAATAAVVVFWLGRPARRSAALVALILADLFFITRFVDVAPSGAPACRPRQSPAARWLAENAPAPTTYRVWGLGRHYHDRPTELLLPKTCEALGLGTFGCSAPWNTWAHAHLFGFDNYGQNRDWANLVRRNHVLSLYGVRYLLAAEKHYREVIESVRIPAGPAQADGPNLLSGRWDLLRAEEDGEVLRFHTPAMWLMSRARQPVALRPHTIYRISLQVRSVGGPAANYLQADLYQKFPDYRWHQEEGWVLHIPPHRIVPHWRRFEWTLRTGADVSHMGMRVHSLGQRPVEARRVRLFESAWPAPVNIGGRLGPGERVYEKKVELPPRLPGDAPVAIYENLLWCRASEAARAPGAEQQIEDLRHADRATADRLVGAPPAVGKAVRAWPGATPTAALAVTTLPAVVVLLAVSAWAALRRSGREPPRPMVRGG